MCGRYETFRLALIKNDVLQNGNIIVSDLKEVLGKHVGLTEEQIGLLIENLRVNLDSPQAGNDSVPYSLLLLMLFEVSSPTVLNHFPAHILIFIFPEPANA